MKDIFPGYIKKTEKEIKEIWEKGIIMFDANVLLNLYRYSDTTKTIILNLIEKFKEQIWLPHQSALEYNRNRYEVIADQQKTYKELTDKIAQIQKDLQTSNKPPFLSESVHKKLDNAFEEVNSEVAESIHKYSNYLRKDPIYEQLSELFKSKITEPFTDKELKEIYKEGEERYKVKTPPGYEDEKTKTGAVKYGDLVLWKQVIKKAKEEKVPVIFITDERKKDWWWKIKDGRNMGPRHELIEEIKSVAEVDFHMYSSIRFLSYGQDFLKVLVDKVALEELTAMKNREIKLEFENQITKEKTLKAELDKASSLAYLSFQKEELETKINVLSKEQVSLETEGIRNSEAHKHYNYLISQISKNIKKLKKINQRIGNIENAGNGKFRNPFHGIILE